MPDLKPCPPHHPDCEGECLWCVIEDCVRTDCGKLALDYLREQMNRRAMPEAVRLVCEEMEAQSRDRGLYRLLDFAKRLREAFE